MELFDSVDVRQCERMHLIKSFSLPAVYFVELNRYNNSTKNFLKKNKSIIERKIFKISKNICTYVCIYNMYKPDNSISIIEIYTCNIKVNALV